MSFSDSLLTASKADSEAGSATNAGPKATRQPKSTSEDAKTSLAVSEGTPIQSPIVSQLSVSQQQAQLTSTAIPAVEVPLAAPVTSSDATAVMTGQPIGDLVAGSTAGTASTIAQLGVAESASNLSSYSQPGRVLFQKAPISSGSSIKGIKALAAAPSTTGNSVSDGGVTASSIAVQSMIPNPVLNAALEGAAKSLPQSALNAVSSVASNASLNAASNTTPIAVPDARSSATANGIANPVLSAASNTIPIAVPDPRSSATANAILNPVLNASPEEAVNSLSQSALNGVASVTSNASLNAASNTIPIATPDAQSNALKNAIQSPVPSAAPDEEQSSLSQSVLNAVSSVASVSSSNAASNLTPIAASTAVSKGLQSSFLKAVLKAFAGVIPSGLANSAPSTAARVLANSGQSSDLSAVHNAVANTVHIEIPDVASNAASNTPLNAEPVLTAHAAQSASPKEGVAPETSSVSTSRAIPPAASPDQTMPATVLNIPVATADQLAAQNQSAGGSLAASQAGQSGLNSTSVTKLSAISSVNGKIGSADATGEATGLKQHAPSASNQANFQTGSQEAVPSADQSQVSASSQGQGTAAAQGSFASHAVVDGAHAQTATIASPVQASPALASATGNAAIAPDRAAPAVTAAPQAPPVINTARLIQSAGQSEMRVGMRSNEFGNISISTSATRDSISAQISLDHGELAKTLAAHLPEIQARLGTNQSVDVRIDSSGARGGLGAGTSGSFSDGASGDSGGSRQQAGNATSSYSRNGFTDRQFSPAALAVTTNDGGLNARLDIRV